MARQLEILALEPFYGGVRKDTLELLARNSRHRWNVFKLPARRIERRLNTAAQWFSQQVSRSSSHKCDVLFVSDAMNLADFLRLKPEMGHRPCVSYFYCNQLAGDAGSDQQARLALLATATSSTEIWFATLFHMREFLSNAAAMLDANPELGGKQPVRALVAKSQIIHPPVEIVPPTRTTNVDAERRQRTVCLDNREGADASIYLELLKDIASRNETIVTFVLGGPLAGVPENSNVTVVDPKNESDIVRTLRCCELYVSSHTREHFDPMAMRAMGLGAIPILRQMGFFREFLPAALHQWCLYGTAQELISKVMDLWYLRRPAVSRRDLDVIFDRYAPITATRNFDNRLEYLVDQRKVN